MITMAQDTTTAAAILKRTYPGLSDKRGEDSFRARLAAERRSKKKPKSEPRPIPQEM